MRLETVTLPLRQDRERDRNAHDVLASASGGHHRVVLGLLAHQHADRGTLAGDRPSRLEGRGVDPISVRGRHERSTRAAERSLAQGGLLLLPDQTGDPHDDEEEQRGRRADQDRQVTGDVAEVLDHHHAGREERGESEQPEPAPRQARLVVGGPLGESSHRAVQRGRPPQDVERRPPGLEVPRLVVHDPLDRQVAVREVRHEQRERCPRHEVEGRGSPTPADREADDDRQAGSGP